jgi:ABC-type transporter Mla maintaining outer membrane lipid asymmetry permease subunit MlaE
MKSMRRWRKRGSPLVEEGLLLGLSIVTLTVVLSIVVGLLSGVQNTFDLSVFNGQGFIDQLKLSVDKILSFFRIG